MRDVVILWKILREKEKNHFIFRRPEKASDGVEMSPCQIISGASSSKLPVLISSSDCHFMCVCQGGSGKYARSLGKEKTVALYKCTSFLLLIRSQDGVNCIVIRLRVCAVFLLF